MYSGQQPFYISSMRRSWSVRYRRMFAFTDLFYHFFVKSRQVFRAAACYQSLICYHFFVYPTVSAGTTWFGGLKQKHDMALVSATPFDNGVVGLTYESRGLIDMGDPQRFTELLA